MYRESFHPNTSTSKTEIFVCYLLERKGSAIGFDQAFEKAYNFTA